MSISLIKGYEANAYFHFCFRDNRFTLAENKILWQEIPLELFLNSPPLVNPMVWL